MKPAESEAGRRDDGGVLERAAILECLAHAGDGRALLTDRDVHAAHLLLRVAGLPGLLLVQDGVDADGGLARLAVTDDELALAAADRGHGVDGLDAGLQGLADALALHDARGLDFERAALLGLDLAEAVEGGTERIDDAAEELVTDRHREHLPGPLDLLALLDLVVFTEDGHADAALVEVERDAEDSTRELEQFLRHRRRQPLDVGDAVTGVGDDADLFALGLGRERLHVLGDSALNLFG